MITCPRCGWSNTRPSLPSGVIDVVCRLLLLAPIRCRSCRIRFHRFALPGSKLYFRKT
jgi:hypothetical protein